MRFGKIAAGLLALAGVVIMLMIILKPGWGSPIYTLGGCSVALLYPAVVILGVIGIFLDKKKRLAILITILAGGSILFYLVMFLYYRLIMYLV